MLECRGLAVSYGRHQALKRVDIRVAPGEIVVILGANGAGKTTLLKAIAGMVGVEASSQVMLDGKAITHQPPHRIVEAGLALVPEGRCIFGDLSVKENLLLGAFAQRARAEQQGRFDHVLNLFPKLAERSAQQARTMSGGEQQMVAIGRALMSAPAILMLDEPSLGLSPLLCIELFRALKEVRKTGVGILLVEQNARQSLAIADRAYLLENGHIVGEGRAEDLARDPAVQAAYLGGAAAASSLAPRAAPGQALVAGSGSGAAATAPPRAVSDAVSAAMASVQPSASPLQPARSTPAEALIPSRIADLVRNATLVQARHVEEQRAGQGLSHGSASGSAAGVAAIGAANGGANAASNLGSNRPAFGTSPATSLAEALARIEAAAAQARRFLPKTAAGPATAAVTAPRGGAALPTIEVWRKPTIEIWRRSADGSLQRGE